MDILHSKGVASTVHEFSLGFLLSLQLFSSFAPVFLINNNENNMDQSNYNGNQHY